MKGFGVASLQTVWRIRGLMGCVLTKSLHTACVVGAALRICAPARQVPLHVEARGSAAVQPASVAKKTYTAGRSALQTSARAFDELVSTWIRLRPPLVP